MNFDDSHIEIVSVSSNWASDPDYVNNRQGPIYFIDCLRWINRAGSDVSHVQFMYAAVTPDGVVRYKPLSHDVHYLAKRNESRSDASNCIRHGYGNGINGLWLAAWVNEVDFADGTAWRAPTGSDLQAAIVDALPKDP